MPTRETQSNSSTEREREAPSVDDLRKLLADASMEWEGLEKALGRLKSSLADESTDSMDSVDETTAQVDDDSPTESKGDIHSKLNELLHLLKQDLSSRQDKAQPIGAMRSLTHQLAHEIAAEIQSKLASLNVSRPKAQGEESPDEPESEPTKISIDDITGMIDQLTKEQ